MRYVKQRLSYKQKIANDYEWAKETIDSLETQADSYMGVRDRITMMERSYDLYGNNVNQADIENVFNPLGINIGQRKDLLHSYNKAHNKINTLIGEMLKRPTNYRNYLISPERAIAVENEKEKLMQEFIVAQINKKMEIEQLNSSDLADEEMQAAADEIEQKYSDVMGPEQIAEHISNEYLEPREIKANSILEDISVRYKTQELKADSFKHALLSGEEHVWVGERNGRLAIDILNPMFVFYHKSPETKYIQDGDYAGIKYKASLGEVLDTYNLDEKDIEYLEGKYTQTSTGSGLSNKMKYQFDNTDYDLRKQLIAGDTADRHRGSYGYSYENLVDVMHVEWRSMTKIGILTYYNEEEQPDSTIVDETFKFDKKDPMMIDIEWLWVEEIWEGTKIDDIYVDMQPIPNQTTTLHNVHNKTLRYHGLIYDNMNTGQSSIMDRMRSFQYLYLIVIHNLKKLIAADKGKLIMFDTTQIDSEFGTEKTLYYMNELNMMPYNSLANDEGNDTTGLSSRGRAAEAIDRSQTQQISNYIALLEYLDNQIGDVAGISRSREGQVGQYETATNAQQSIIQSSNITEILFFAHNKLWERVLEKAVNIEASLKKPGYHTLMSRNSLSNVRTLIVREDEFENADFQIFLTNSPEDAEIFNQIKMLYQPLLQHGKAKFSQIIKMLQQKNSTQELIRDIEKFEQVVEMQQQQEQQNAMEQTRMAQETEIQKEQMRMQHEKELQHMKDQTDITVEKIRALGFAKDQDINNNNVPDVLEIERLKHEVTKSNRELDIKEKELKQKEEESKRNAELKKKEIAQKNKTSGSK